MRMNGARTPSRQDPMFCCLFGAIGRPHIGAGSLNIPLKARMVRIEELHVFNKSQYIRKNPGSRKSKQDIGLLRQIVVQLGFWEPNLISAGIWCCLSATLSGESPARQPEPLDQQRRQQLCVNNSAQTQLLCIQFHPGSGHHFHLVDIWTAN